LRIFGFLSALAVSCLIIISLYTRFVPKPFDRYHAVQDSLMRINYGTLKEKVKTLQEQMAELEKRDNQVYRSIFEANPLPDSTRAKLIERTKEIEKVNVMNDEELGNSIAKTLDNISARIAFQGNSYTEIQKLINNQEEKLASIPAIQPVSNKDLTRIASGYGMRIDPVYGTPKMHKGLDFTAPQGTPIYATGDGVVSESGYTEGGYGNHVVINHGYSYETLYGHMVRVKVRNGQRVKRGEIIGWVGSTGKSTGPHCHYEVHVNGEAVDPVYFFFNDLNAEQYDRLLKLAATGSAKSLD
jgi:murein DD-endopeptidase MepM/ murein hydrolase activator NlpD